MHAAHCPSGSVRFFFQPAPLQLLHKQHWECVCTTAHALESFSTRHSTNPNRISTTTLVTTLPSTILSVDSLAPRRHSPALGQLLLILASAPVHVEDHLHHRLHRLTPVCNSASSSLFFHRVVAPISVLVHLTSRHIPWASLPPLTRVAAPPARSSARCRAACPHVGLSPQPTLEAPREGLRQGEVRGGGAGRKLSRPRFETKCCGVCQVPRQDLFGSHKRTHGDTTGDQNSDETMNYKVHHNRIYNNIQ